MPAGGRGRSPKPSYLGPRPASVATVAAQLPPTAWRTVRWRDGTQGPLESRFAALRIQPRAEYRTGAFQQPVGSLLIKCPPEAAPTNYSLANLAAPMSLHRLVRWAKSPWRIDQDYRQATRELKLDHYEGRSLLDYHHHVTLVMVAHGLLML